MRVFLISILSVLILSASSINQHQVRILEKILSEISIDAELKIWSDNKEISSQIKNNNNFTIVQNYKESNVIILEDKKNLKENSSTKRIFVLNYKLLSDIKQSFGALFWKKGRPNIVIIEPRIKAQSITITKDLEPYLEEKVW